MPSNDSRAGGCRRAGRPAPSTTATSCRARARVTGRWPCSAFPASPPMRNTARCLAQILNSSTPISSATRAATCSGTNGPSCGPCCLNIPPGKPARGSSATSATPAAPDSPLILAVMAEPAAGSSVRLAELLAILSLATDLGMGQPMEHVLRQCLISLRLAQYLGLDEADRVVVYYAALLAWVGCHVDAYEQANWFGDDMALKADFRRVDFA